jgi:hypothetical protein
VTPRDSAASILLKRAELTRQLAALDEALAIALRAIQTPDEPDRVLTLDEAAAHVGEPPSTFRQRLCYRRAQVSGPRQRRLRFSQRTLDRILQDRGN